MPFSMKLWQVQGKDLQEINHEALNDEQRLEDWVVKDPSILGIDVLLVGRQVTTANRGRIDLLAIDDEANLVVLELKRDKTPREIVAQALDYASWVKTSPMSKSRQSPRTLPESCCRRRSVTTMDFRFRRR
jgi:RecB family endonuclease NucS